MAQPVTGKDVVIMFQKEDDYFAYACAESVELNSKMTTKSVKTVGDGVWRKTRGQSLEYNISLTGVVKFDDDTVPHAFDLYDYHRSMTHIPYRMIFTNDLGALKVIEGIALPVDVNLGGGSEGFANGSFSLEGDGAVEVRDLIIPCPSSITSIQLIEDTPNSIIRITGHTGSPARYDYAVDGGGFVSQFANSFIQDLILEGGLGAGVHSLIIIPVCDNGYNGTPYETTFELMGTGGGGCDAPTDVVFTLITENTATASWTPPGTPPGDGYYWELFIGTSFQDSGTETGTSVNLTGLTGGLTYTFKVRSICESGVSESGFVSDTFVTDTPANPTQINWFYGEEGGASGRLAIKVNGVEQVNTTDPDSGTLLISGGDEITVDVTEGFGGGDIKDLYIQDLTTSTVLYSNTDANPQHFVFTAVADHVYELQSNVYNS
jgi:hypothetical protein